MGGPHFVVVVLDAIGSCGTSVPQWLPHWRNVGHLGPAAPVAVAAPGPTRMVRPGAGRAARRHHSTVRNDIERLRLMGYAVQSRTGVAGGYRLGPGAAMPPLLLDDDEAVAVGLGLECGRGTVTGIEETSLRAMTKLEQTRCRPGCGRGRAATGHRVGSGRRTDRGRRCPGDAGHRLPRRPAAALRLYRPAPARRSSAGSSRIGWSTPGTVGTCWPGTATERTGAHSGLTGSPHRPPGRGSRRASRRRTSRATSSGAPRPRRGASSRHGSACTPRRGRSPTGSPGGLLTAVDEQSCVLETGGDSLLNLVGYLTSLDVAFDVLDPPELRDLLAPSPTATGRPPPSRACLPNFGPGHALADQGLGLPAAVAEQAEPRCVQRVQRAAVSHTDDGASRDPLPDQGVHRVLHPLVQRRGAFVEKDQAGRARRIRPNDSLCCSPGDMTLDQSASSSSRPVR